MAAISLAIPASVQAHEFHDECRNYSAKMTVRCAAILQDPPGGVEKAVAVWECESGFGQEYSHSDSYHGPFQYMTSTYTGQRLMLDDVRRWFELSPYVHDVRSNIVLAVAWAAHYDWGPWSCA